MSTPPCTSAKPWEQAWRATARLQCRCEREWEQRLLKLNIYVGNLLSDKSMLWVWWWRDKAGCEWQAKKKYSGEAWPLIHSRGSPASSWFESEALIATAQSINKDWHDTIHVPVKNVTQVFIWLPGHRAQPHENDEVGIIVITYLVEWNQLVRDQG